MFDHMHYVPILKGREGEYGALRELHASSRDQMTPLIEIPPIPWDFVNNRPSKSLDLHLERVCEKVKNAWGGNRILFLDTLWLPDEARMIDGQHPLTFITKKARPLGLRIVPVTGLLRGEGHATGCRTANSSDGWGVCIRIQREDFVEFTDLRGELNRLLEAIQVPCRSVDLLLDLRAIAHDAGAIDEDEVISLITKIPFISKWRSFTIAATSFPANLVGLPPSDCSKVQRLEWKLWKAVHKILPDGIRRPAFGDYAISHPEPSEVDPRIMNPSASIRYTSRSHWLVVKAKNLKDHGYAQFHGVCKQMVQRADYSGASFSWGDGYIAACGCQSVGPGNLTTWRKVGTSHHLAFVLDQLSNFAEASA
jgi:hypothetical protein